MVQNAAGNAAGSGAGSRSGSRSGSTAGSTAGSRSGSAAGSRSGSTAGSPTGSPAKGAIDWASQTIDPAWVFRVDCPSRPILDQIADKWSVMAMAVLDEPRRFNEIKRRLEGITQRVLTQTLRRLERNGMIVRRVLPTSPVGVEYSLTPMGRSLQEPFGRLYAWTVEHVDEIYSSQRDYDEGNAD